MSTSRHRSWSGVWQQASGAGRLFGRFVSLCLQFGEALGADRLDEGLEMPHAVGEPFQFFLGDLVVLGVAGLHIGPAQQVEGAVVGPATARPGIDQALVQFLR